MTFRVITGGRDEVAERGLLVVGAAEVVTMADGERSAEPHSGAVDASGPSERPDRELVVAVWDGRIAAVGPRAEVGAVLERQRLPVDRFRELDARGGTVTPGLVDPHTHLLFAGTRERELRLRQQGAAYLQILEAGGGILSTVAATRSASREELVQHGRRWLGEMLRHGVTTIEAKTGYGLDVETELRLLDVYGQLAGESPIDIVPTFLGAHAVPLEYRDRSDGTDAYVAAVISEQLPAVAAQGIAKFCDVFCERGVFDAEQSRRILIAARELGLGARLHADELAPSGGAELAVEIAAASADHLAAISHDGIEALAGAAASDSPTVATLLPATTWFLMSDHYAPARRLLDSGVPVALGTDFNPGTSPTPNLPLVMTVACLSLGLTAHEALRAVTINAARAVGLEREIGSIEVGKAADLVVWRVPAAEQIPYWPGADLVSTVIKRGRPIDL